MSQNARHMFSRRVPVFLAILLLVTGVAYAHDLKTPSAPAGQNSGLPAEIMPSGAQPSTPAPQRTILFWYDPMHPSYKSDKAGIAPDCGMALVPMYVGEAMAGMSMPKAPVFHPFLTILLLAGLAGMAFAFFLKRSGTPSQDRKGFDLLRIPWIKAFVKWKYFQPALQIPNLLVFALVIYLGFFDIQDGGQNFATKLTWTIWWAAIIFAFVFVGRLWCAMCPFGALTLWASRLFSPVRRFPPKLRNIWTATLAFALLTWADVFFGIVGSPSRTAWLVIIISAVAILIGIFYQRATFCRYLCPIGGMIGLYSMVSPLELRSSDRTICATCSAKSCYRGSEAGEGCIMFEFPSVMDRNNYCNLCGECVKTCPNDNISFRLRPFMGDINSRFNRRFDESFLAILLVGLVFMVTGEMVGPWHEWMDQVARFLPFSALGITGEESIEKWTFTIIYLLVLFLVAPLILLLASMATRRATRPARLSLRKTFITFGYMFIPVGLALHLAHNLLHLLKEGPGIVPVLQRTIERFTPFFVGVPNWHETPLVSNQVIYYLQMAVLFGAFLFSLVIGWKLSTATYNDKRLALKAVIPMVLISAGFTFLNVFILSQPMSMRHTH
jgi:ferredoxin